ncbi:uncharacterized protein LOC113305460 [Papaver somniferum]|uniref:uncharacterized protein LOC113305460 n=1 Tax=Papaver somniferum TaxID=3469 RepID=UPI000E6FDD66|nr:uncharacterized protein LOC113305460 [Papaver somniferum]
MFSSGNNSPVYNLVNPVHDNENYLMNFSELLLGAIIRYQKGGWLLISRDHELFFYNPFTREAIKVPDFPGYYNMSNISFSSIPTPPSREMCLVMAMNSLCTALEGGNMIGALMTLMRKSYDGALGNFNLANGNFGWEVLEKPHQQFNDSFPNFLAECGGDLLLVKLGGLETALGLNPIGQSLLLKSLIGSSLRHWREIKFSNISASSRTV